MPSADGDATLHAQQLSLSVDFRLWTLDFRLWTLDFRLPSVNVLGITGGIGMGKSTADKLLRERGVPVVDTDLLAREIVEPGQPAAAEIRQAFGPEVFDADGRLRRDELARRVFANDSARQRLEDILH